MNVKSNGDMLRTAEARVAEERARVYGTCTAEDAGLGADGWQPEPKTSPAKENEHDPVGSHGPNGERA